MDLGKQFQLLEEKIQKAVQLIDQLRKEKQHLQEELEGANARLAKAPDDMGQWEEMKQQLKHLESEVGKMKKERQTVQEKLSTILDRFSPLDL